MTKKIFASFALMLFLIISAPLARSEKVVNYFPSTIDSYWVYEDKDGNTLKRTVIEGEEISGEIYKAFNYEPELKEWEHFIKYICPELFRINDKKITLSVKEGIEKAVKAQLNKELDFLFQALTQDKLQIDDAPTFDISVEAEDNISLLIKPTVTNEDWDVTEINAKIEVTENGEVQSTLDYTIVETGIILGTETVETTAGSFENCLKVQYQTETAAIFTPEEGGMNPPGETVSTVWFAPNVGIVKIHEKKGNMFLDMILKDEDIPFVIPPPKETTLTLKKFEIKTEEPTSVVGEKKAVNYFPSTVDSYWVYEDQDGNTLKRTVIEGEEIAGETYHAFNYEPEIEDWVDFSRFIHPELFKLSDKGITLSVKEEVEKAVHARLTKEMQIAIEGFKNDVPNNEVEPTYDIKVEVEKDLLLLNIPIDLNEEWESLKINATMTSSFAEDHSITIDFTIIETGIVKGKETIETLSGTFENCLKVQYWTETVATFDQDVESDEVDPPGETFTTVWFAPNVGIVKIHEKKGNLFLDMIPKDEDIPFVIPPPKETTLTLKKFEIKTEKPTNEKVE